jgi:hypothetical protein
MGQVYCYLNYKKSPEECVRHPDQLCICHRQIFDLFCREREKIILFLQERFFSHTFSERIIISEVESIPERDTHTRREFDFAVFWQVHTEGERKG